MSATSISRLHVARKERRHDEWDPPVEPYGPYAPVKGDDVITDEGDASPDAGDASPKLWGYAPRGKRRIA